MICTYPSSHVTLANECIKSNSHVFIEKPLSTNLTGVEVMLRRAKLKNLKVAVGYNLRFDKGLNLLKKKFHDARLGLPLSIRSEWGHNLKFWRAESNHKNHYILKKGGGIILDDSHEYDYLRWVLEDEPKSVYCLTKKSQYFDTETESLASIIIKFKKGTIANLIIDCVRPLYQRSCHIIYEKGDLRWTYELKKNFVSNYRIKAESQVTENFLNGKSGLSKNFNISLNDMYVNEVKNFLNSIINKEKILVDGWDGLSTLKLGIAALKSAQKERVIRL